MSRVALWRDLEDGAVRGEVFDLEAASRRCVRDPHKEEQHADVALRAAQAEVPPVEHQQRAHPAQSEDCRPLERTGRGDEAVAVPPLGAHLPYGQDRERDDRRPREDLVRSVLVGHPVQPTAHRQQRDGAADVAADVEQQLGRVVAVDEHQ